MLATAARPDGISALFMTLLYADKRDCAPPSVHIFSRALGEPSHCSNTILADPAFMPAPS